MAQEHRLAQTPRPMRSRWRYVEPHHNIVILDNGSTLKTASAGDYVFKGTQKTSARFPDIKEWLGEITQIFTSALQIVFKLGLTREVYVVFRAVSFIAAARRDEQMLDACAGKCSYRLCKAGLDLRVIFTFSRRVKYNLLFKK